MKKVLVLLVIAAGALLFYLNHQKQQEPFKAFTAYADAVARGRHDLARQYADGEIANEDQGERYAEAGWVPVQEIRDLSYVVNSQTRSADGEEVAFDVTQTLAFNPPGVESAIRAAMKATFHQTATVRKTGSGWKVVAFKSDFTGSSENR